MSRKDIRALPTMPGVYEIVNAANGKRYVGSSENVRTRCRKHIGDLRSGRHTCRHLLNAWRKYGAESFAFRLIETTLNDRVLLAAREQVWIDRNLGRLYNHCRYADPNCPEWWRSDAAAPARERRRKHFVEMWAKREGKTFTCVVCGKAFLARHPMGASYCSDACYFGEAERTGKFKEKRTCPRCGREFATRKHCRPDTCCSRQCGRLHNSAFGPDSIRSILRRIAAGESMRRIAGEFEVDQTSIQNIGKRRAWAHVPVEPDIEAALRRRFATKGMKPDSRKLSDNQVREIRRLLASGEVQQREVASRFGISECLVSGIKQGKRYADVPPDA